MSKLAEAEATLQAFRVLKSIYNKMEAAIACRTDDFVIPVELTLVEVEIIKAGMAEALG